MSTISAGTTSGTTLVATGDTAGTLVFKTNDTGSGGTTALTIDTSQNVGIGTSSASYPLTVRTSGTSTTVGGNIGLRVESNGSGYAATLQFSDNVTNSSAISMIGSATAFLQAGSERMRIDSSGNVGIGTSAPVAGSRLTVVGGGIQLSGGTTAQAGLRVQYASSVATITGINNDNNAFNPIAFYTSGSEAMRIDSSGNLLVGKTTSSTTTQGNAIGPVVANFIASTASPSDGPQIQIGNIAASVANGYRFISFRVNAVGTEVGSITTNGSSTTSYNTSSDYRLKENIAPMTGALAKVAALKPCTYTWKSNGSAGEGFIAHELAEVCPSAVVGQKDAVDANGDPQYQGVDTSFLVATLAAAIQELNAKVTALETQINQGQY